MTRERVEAILLEYEQIMAGQESSWVDESLLMWGETLAALRQAIRKLTAWESCGLTEEMLRNHEGYLKINRGVVMVSEHYLKELQCERDTALARIVELERGEYICQKCGLRKDGGTVDADF